MGGIASDVAHSSNSAAKKGTNKYFAKMLLNIAAPKMNIVQGASQQHSGAAQQNQECALKVLIIKLKVN